ncbi:MAG: sigma-70 family RNA polymerase sigma factor [Planctomycetaceae bacterium]|jgi:RNA polymerase sigma-70 factor (ECF subfamily)|nr:sigma-70 family RNA polymerase sigma factor [Planctomycetaceae bacterium]
MRRCDSPGEPRSDVLTHNENVFCRSQPIAWSAVSSYRGDKYLDATNDQTRWLNEQAPRLILFARQWVPCHADAEDVFHTAFVRFWRERDRVRDPLPFLYTCVRRAALNWRREQGRREKRELAVGPEPLFATDQDRLVKAETDEAIEAALLRLSDEQREVVVMRIWGELTFPQIGEVLSISASTADTRYRSGLKKLRLALDGKVVP